MAPPQGRLAWRAAGKTALDQPTRPAHRAALLTRDAAEHQLFWLTAIGPVAGLAVLVVALADAGARLGAPWAGTWLWCGLLALVVPIILWLAMPGVSRSEAIGLVIILGFGLYLIKVLHSPLYFTLYDELLHLRTATDVATAGRLFGQNPLLPISPLYPGLEIVTDALASLSGLTVFQSGLVLIGVARLMMSLGVYLFFEHISGSVRVAGLASALYTAHPQFLFFDAQYSYESLALPLARLTLVVLARREHSSVSERRPLLVVAAIMVLATVITHHVTAYVLTGCLLVWTVISAIQRRRGGAGQPGVGWLALLALAANLTWLFTVASITVTYLGPPVVDALQKIIHMVLSGGSIRPPFQSIAGSRPPLIEQMIGFGSVGLIVLGLPFGLLQLARRYHLSPPVVLLALAALAYPASLPLRLLDAWEISARAAAWLFLGVGFVLAVGFENAARPELRHLLRTLAFVICVAVVFAGGVMAGVAPIARLPGAHRVGTTPSGIDSLGIAAAEWADQALGPDHRVAADYVNTALMGSYGEQDAVTNLADNVSISPLFLAPEIGAYQRSIVRQARIRYAVVDYRLTQSLPVDGYCYEKWEKIDYPYTEPIRREVLDKFDYINHVSRVFDSGDIVIYDIGALANVP